MGEHIAFATAANFPISPRHARRRNSCSLAPQWSASLVAVVGATGGVGSLLVDRLLSAQQLSTDSTAASSPRSAIAVSAVRVLTRSIAKARQTLPDDPNLSFSHIPSIVHATPDQLELALKHVEVLAICTGSTAFPTRRWLDGNAPTSVDDTGIRNLVNAVDPDTIKRIVMVSSIGTARTSQFPFSIINMFGLMDSKRKGEIHVKNMAEQLGVSYAIVRCGRLLGAPHSNEGMIRDEPDPNKLNVELAVGDSLSGELSRSAAADVMFLASTWDTSVDFDIAAVHTVGTPPPIQSWEKKLMGVQTKRELSQISGKTRI